MSVCMTCGCFHDTHGSFTNLITAGLECSRNLKVSSRASFWMEERPRRTAMLSTVAANGTLNISSSLAPPNLVSSKSPCGVLHRHFLLSLVWVFDLVAGSLCSVWQCVSISRVGFCICMVGDVELVFLQCMVCLCR